jgi:4-amino-4-deoxy-L-arabinose transferase-like glycosyltransferase
MKYYFFALVFIIFVGAWLRYSNLSTIPRHGATFDEFAWTWQGINLIQKGIPISWSPHPQYTQKKHLIYQGAAFWIVKPYLEHPPLFGLVAASFALLNGVSDMYHVTLDKIRPLSLILGTFSIFMIFVLCKELYDKKTALIASLLYATIPTIVIGSRLVQNENFLIPFWLLSLYLVSIYLKTGKKMLLVLAGIIAGLLSLAKVPWLIVGLSLSMVLIYKRKWKDAFIVSGLTILIFSFFIFYGMYYDKELFFSLWRLQLSRYDISFSGIFSIFTNPLLVDWGYLDGWILFGWFSMFLALKNLKKNAMIVIPFIAYFILFAFAIPNEPGHGWYRYPFYPFLIISTALFIKEEFIKPSLSLVLFFLVIGLSLMANTWEQAFGFSYPIYRASIIIWSLPILSLLLPSKKTEFITKTVVILSIICFIILNIFAVFSYHG